MLALKTLTPDDWPIWREMRQEALGESPSSFGSKLAEWQGPGDTEARWRGRLTTVPFNLVALLDGRNAGMASGNPASDRQVELISMWVAPWARGRGVGDRLISAVVDWAAPAAVLLRVYQDNAHATRLYQRQGFVWQRVELSENGRRENVMVRPARP